MIDLELPENCSDCTKAMCNVTIPRFHYKHLGKESTTLVNGIPAQNALLWDFFEFALLNCFMVTDFRVMLFYGLYEHDLDYFMRETDELPPDRVIDFMKRTNQVVRKLSQDFQQFKRYFGRYTKITDLIPNMITIIQMQMLELAHAYLKQHENDLDFPPYTLEDIIT